MEEHIAIRNSLRNVANFLEDQHIDSMQGLVEDAILFINKSFPVDKPVKPESNGQIKYAIKHKDKFMLMQVSNSEKQLEEKIEQAYLLAHSIQPKGSNYTREDFMQDIEKVKVTFEKIG